MTRPLRLEAPGECVHVLSRGNDRRPIFADDHDRTTFLDILAETCERSAIACHAYCLMGNHYHLLLQPQESNLSSALHRLNGTYAQRVNRRHDRSGHLFEGRFKSLLVDRDAYLLTLCRYIVLNPVRAGLVDHPASWPWSSYRATAGLAAPPRFLSTELVLGSMLPVDREGARREYVSFVCAGMSDESGDQDMNRALETGGVLGSTTFRSRFGPSLESRRSDRELLRSHRFATRPSLAAILGDPCDGTGLPDRMRRAFRKHGYRLGEIAATTGLSVSTVQRAIRSVRPEGDDTVEGPSV